MYQRILVATDGSALSRKAFHSAIALTAALGAELVALHVVPRYPVSHFEVGVFISSQDVSRVEKQWADKGQAVVDAVRQAAQAEGVEAKAVIARSDRVAESVMAAAKNTRATSSSWPRMAAGASSACCWAAKPSMYWPTAAFPCWCGAERVHLAKSSEGGLAPCPKRSS